MKSPEHIQSESTEPVLVEEDLPSTGGIPPWWTNLYERAANANIFLSPSWVSTWLDTYAMDFSIKALSWWSDKHCIAGMLLLSRPDRRGPFPVRLSVVNTAGETDENGPYIEYNDILCLPGHEDQVAASLTEYLAGAPWDRLYLAGYTETSLLSKLLSSNLPGKPDSIGKTSRYIDLAAVGSEDMDGTFSSNTRTQIRRSIRIYEKRGEIRVEAATSADECVEYLDALAELHRDAWDRRGLPGGFRSERFIAFHKQLIRDLWGKGQVELLRVSAGNDIVGYIYNYLSENKVYFYQSGFSYEDDPKVKPGLVTHYLAATEYLKRGFSEYDFMAGDSQYKRSLAKSSRKLYWSWVDRSNTRMHIINGTARIMRFIRNRLSRTYLGSVNRRPPLQHG